jgi:putative ABC transport system permease protein
MLAGFVIKDLRGSGRSLLVLCACLMLGVTLIAASGGLYQQVRGSLLADTRAMFGGDLEVRDRAPLPAKVLQWMKARARVSLLIELRTMARSEDDRFQLVELQSFDESYPLYGEVALAPTMSLSAALAPTMPLNAALAPGRHADGEAGLIWGAAFDPLLGERLGLGVGDRITLGALTLELRARIERQPDRSLRAAWRGPPLMLSSAALDETGLLVPGSRVAYRYRVRVDGDADRWREEFTTAFNDGDWEVRTFSERSERIAEVLGQLASGLLLIGFSALFIGGLGVFNSVHAYLQGKLGTLATLRALGVRDRRLAHVYLLQILMLAALASVLGALLGGALAIAGTVVVADSLPLAPALHALVAPLLLSVGFGLLTALTFALPALGRAVSVSPAALFRGVDGTLTATSGHYWLATAASAMLLIALVLLALPDLKFGVGFVLTVLGLLALLEALVRALRWLAPRLSSHPRLAGNFALHLALANLYRPGSSLRPMLLSLGSALTLLVASALVVAALGRTIDETIPRDAPALVFYDIALDQVETVRSAVSGRASFESVKISPLVLGRLAAVNGEALRDSDKTQRMLEARDEHKLTYREGNIDQVVADRGTWWPEAYSGPPLVGMEDREADQLDLQVGDRLRFEIMGQAVEAELAVIFAQRRYQARFWFEAMFSPKVLDPYVTRYVGAARLGSEDASAAQSALARSSPNIITVATMKILDDARDLLAKAAAGLVVLAAVSLAASLLVLAGVVVSSRERQLHEAVLLHTLGARLAVIRNALRMEYLLVALLASLVAVLLGVSIAVALLHFRLGLPTDAQWWLGAAVALGASAVALGVGSRYLLRELRLSPALMLKSAG